MAQPLSADGCVSLTRRCAVGVTGSGKGMTEVAPRGKHKFEAADGQDA